MAAASVFNVTSGRVVQYSSTRLKRADLVPSSADAEPMGTHASRLVSGCRPMQGAYTWRPSGRGEQQPHRAPVAHTIFFPEARQPARHVPGIGADVALPEAAPLLAASSASDPRVCGEERPRRTRPSLPCAA